MQDGGSRQMCQYRILLLHLLRDGGDDISRDDVRFHDDDPLHDGNAPLFPPLRLLVALCHESGGSCGTFKVKEVGMDNLIQVYICIVALYNLGTGLQGVDNLPDTF